MKACDIFAAINEYIKLIQSNSFILLFLYIIFTASC